MASSMAVGTAYIYPYAQVIDLCWSPGHVAWPTGGLALVTLAAGLSLVSLLALGRRFGVRPALRDLVTSGPLQIRPPPDVSLVYTWRHRVQPTGMEFRHNSPGVGRLGVSRLSHPRRGASTVSTCRMANLRRLGSLPPFPRSLVKAPLAQCRDSRYNDRAA
jgi:hypothetical protein